LKDGIFPGKWQNVGGKVELGERVEEAIKREVKEEIGLKVKPKPIFLMSYSWRKDDTEPYRLGLIFLVVLNTLPNKKIKLNRELSSFGWFTYDEILKMNGEDLLIGRDSPRGTLEQIKATKKI
jgi:nucleoside triphosphatase